jgi:hypothetical protein
MRMMLSLAEFEIDRVRENWRVAQQRAVNRGIHIASKVSTGYVRGTGGRLQLHPEFADAVAEVFRMRSAGASWRELSAFLNARGVVGPYLSPHWRTRAVTHLIANPVTSVRRARARSSTATRTRRSSTAPPGRPLRLPARISSRATGTAAHCCLG